jgi:prepilin-type N-terminal cleavage/methylation domain-containing protein
MNKTITNSAKVSKRGFTLVELLVVIGILAILTAAVVVVLNPAELLKQSRDAQRLSDFDALRSAISLYLSTASNPSFGSSTIAYTSGTGATACQALTTGCNTSRIGITKIDGTGWVPINFNELTAVGLTPPLSALPLDPISNNLYYYAGAFTGASTTLYYQLDSKLESTKYSTRMISDGGPSTSTYEVGNAPGLNL